MKQQYKHDVVGGNFRIDAMQAALLRVKLKHLPAAEALRISHADFYREEIKTNKVVLPVYVRGKHVYNQFTLRIPGNRDLVF
jgi:dTDP-4-amino-4,6-dideoxygalactose transaminase